MGFGKPCPLCGVKYFSLIHNRCPHCDGIDFKNIKSVYIADAETAYRIETEEEFDIVKSNYLSSLDGWQHYETSEIEYEVEDGENYTFLIRYKNGTHEYRKYHSSSPFAVKLLNCQENTELQEDLENVLTEVAKIFTPQPSESDYEIACTNFKQMQRLYSLNENSTDDDYVGAAEIKMSSLLMAEAREFKQSIYELMLYLLSTAEDGDILKKVASDGLSFLQQSEKGPDAFAVLEKNTDVTKDVLLRYEKVRLRRSYRKVILLTTGNQKVTMTDSNIVVWDLKKLCMAYVSAFKKAVTEKEPTKKVEEPRKRLAVIDFETTGLNYNFHKADHDEIISVAIIDQDEKVILNTYCNTMKKRSWDEAERINGISPSDVKGYPTFAEILPEVVEILLSYDYVIAYNVKFEKAFLFNYALHYGNGDRSVLQIRWGRDPMEMFMEYMGSDKFLKLEMAAKTFGYQYNAHDALEDVKATLYVYNALSGE